MRTLGAPLPAYVGSGEHTQRGSAAAQARCDYFNTIGKISDEKASATRPRHGPTVIGQPPTRPDIHARRRRSSASGVPARGDRTGGALGIQRSITKFKDIEEGKEDASQEITSNQNAENSREESGGALRNKDSCTAS